MKAITAEEWYEQNIVPQNSFENIERDNPLAVKYRPKTVTMDDLFLTDEIEDDTVNVVVQLADYDWMTYMYDIRIPTKDNGTFVARFAYYGLVESEMYVRQFIPTYLTGETVNYKVDRRYVFPTSLFNKFMEKDLQGRIDNFSDTYAYCPADLMLEWFNAVLEQGKEADVGQMPEDMHWMSVRIPHDPVPSS